MSNKDYRFSHLKNNQPQMVDISNKVPSSRLARAEGRIRLDGDILAGLSKNTPPGQVELNSAKGPIIKTAIISGTMAVKKTADLIPFAHPLLLSAINFLTQLRDNELVIRCEVKTRSTTGVEMEALTGVSVALLTIYDMCKSISSNMEIGKIRLIKKTGGKKDIDQI